MFKVGDHVTVFQIKGNDFNFLKFKGESGIIIRILKGPHIGEYNHEIKFDKGLSAYISPEELIPSLKSQNEQVIKELLGVPNEN